MSLLVDLERLHRLHAKGMLTRTELDAAKTQLLDEVPEAEAPLPKVELPPIVIDLAKSVLPPLLAGGVALLLGAMPMLAFTLAVTVLAAIIVAQFRDSEEQD